jgi:hypothetical protein
MPAAPKVMSGALLRKLQHCCYCRQCTVYCYSAHADKPWLPHVSAIKNKRWMWSHFTLLHASTCQMVLFKPLPCNDAPHSSSGMTEVQTCSHSLQAKADCP